MKHLLSLLILSLALTACSSSNEGVGTTLSNKEERAANRGKLTGDDGWVVMGGSGKKDGSGSGGMLGVNGYLWRATLDTLSFMPMASADPFGGTVITDWYEDPKTPGERFKVNALILDGTLRADGVKVSVFKQRSEKGQWRDQKVDDTLARQLEDAILTRARQLKVQQLRK